MAAGCKVIALVELTARLTLTVIRQRRRELEALKIPSISLLVSTPPGLAAGIIATLSRAERLASGCPTTSKWARGGAKREDKLRNWPQKN